MKFYQSKKVAHIHTGYEFSGEPYALCGRYLDELHASRVAHPTRRLCKTCRAQLKWILECKLGIIIKEQDDDEERKE